MATAQTAMLQGGLLWVVADPSSSNAGYRIRTQPLLQALERRGLSVQAISYAEFYRTLPDGLPGVGAVVMAKPGDTASYLCLRALQDRGVPVALDLFDNYFSWSKGVAQRHLHWQWLRHVAAADLVLTSTRYLEQVLGSLRQGPLLRVADPLPAAELPAAELAARERKWQDADARLEVTWFGIANNGYYAVGLEDLNDWRAALLALRDRRGGAAGLRLTLCTNRVSALDATLAQLRRDGIVTRFVEWSEAACSSLVAASHLVLLPTNLSGFSLSKTHNRCSDALVRHCLVLASPHGPYRGLGGAVFVSMQPLLDGLDRARLRPQLVAELAAASLARLAPDCDLESNARRLHEALAALPAPRPRAAGPRVLITARARLETVKLSRRLGYLTAGCAEGVIKPNMDFTLKTLGQGPALASMQMSDKGWTALQHSLSQQPQLDIAENEQRMVCRSRGWHLLIDKPALRCDILQLASPAQEVALRRAHAMSLEVAHQVEGWYDTMMELLVTLLAELGLGDQDYATEEAGGWAAFAATADPALAAAEQRLQGLWQAHADCELLWGATTPAAAH